MCLEDSLVLAQRFDFQVIIKKVPHHTYLLFMCQWQNIQSAITDRPSCVQETELL